MSERRQYRNDAEYMDALESQLEAKDAEIHRLESRIWAMATLLYPYHIPREAVAGDIGWPTQVPQGEKHGG